MAAFNDIEAHLRSELNAKKSDSFWWMAGKARERNLISEQIKDDLREFGELRNAISHGQYHGFRPIAEPLKETVTEIEHIRDMLLHPPLVREVLGVQRVISVAPSDSIRVPLSTIKDTAISQFPVYEDDTCVDLLTTNTIARWVAADLDDDDHLDAKTVADVLRYAEANDYAVFLPRDVTAQETIEAMTQPDKSGALPRVAILTEHGKNTQRPIRVVGSADLALLIDAVTP